MKRYRFIFLLFLFVFIMVGCQAPETGVRGTLILQTGQSGDVRNSRVQLFQTSDLTGTPVKEVASDASGVDPTRSTFEFTDVLPGYYYILAWKDLNGNGKIDHLDIVGVYGGKYKPGYGGTQLTVKEGEITDVGEIVMYIYKELKFTIVSAEVDANNLLTIRYQFNDDCYLSSFKFVTPDELSASDDTQVGNKTANTVYSSGPWVYGNYDPWPHGTYTVTVTGTYEDASFELVATFTL